MKKSMLLTMLAFTVLAASCSSDDDATSTNTNSNLTLNLDGLEALGDDFVYEGWIIVNGSPVSSGRFSSVDFPQSFSVDADQLEAATTFVLSIEPTIDPDPAPAATKILAGDFTQNLANVNSNAIVADFSTATGTYILATPTDDDMTNEFSGVWFLDNSSTPPSAGLNLPALPQGWVYEGWAVIDGTPLSTGTFTNVAATDNNAPFSGPNPLPMPNGSDGFFPGEDFLINAPSGLTFPLDLKEQTVVITVEPSPDNSPAPFTFKPLAHNVPATAAQHSPINMGDGPLKMLSGTVTR